MDKKGVAESRKADWPDGGRSTRVKSAKRREAILEGGAAQGSVGAAEPAAWQQEGAPPYLQARRGGSSRIARVSEDLAYGQIVIVAARWVLVLAALVLSLWLPGTLGELRLELTVILVLAVANFYLHAQLLMHRPAVDGVAYLASAADLTFVTLLVAAHGGLRSDLYIFYFPAVVALSVAFSGRMTVLYAGAAATAYALIGGATLHTDADGQALVTRLVMIAAVAVCGHLYWRIEGDRRRGAAAVRRDLLAELDEE